MPETEGRNRVSLSNINGRDAAHYANTLTGEIVDYVLKRQKASSALNSLPKIVFANYLGGYRTPHLLFSQRAEDIFPSGRLLNQILSPSIAPFAPKYSDCAINIAFKLTL